MRLLECDNNGNYSLTPDMAPSQVPSYAILSHTWGPDEVIFADFARAPIKWQRKAGFEKIKFCAQQAKRDGLQYFWVDTCCIDKSNSIELQTAINSMFRWYQKAERCYVYLADVSGPPPWSNAFKKSKWFTRGWTLQELIAPKTVNFYSRDGDLIGCKQSLGPIIRDITGIPSTALRGAPLSEFPILEREAWIRGRQTKYEEDMAYSLLGLFDVHLPLIYGEGQEKAQKRLREEVQKAIRGTPANDFSISFSLFEAPETEHFIAREAELIEMRRVLSSDGSRRVVILHGLGGIGKTQLAVAFMKRFRNEYSAIFWLNIKDKSSIEQSFAKVARQILQEHSDASYLSTIDLQGDQDEVVKAVKAWLSLPGNTRWLIVYDNYDNPQLSDQPNDKAINISHFLPMSWQGSIIITTRLSQVDIGHRIPIKKLSPIQDGLRILSLTSGRDISSDLYANILAEKLDGLPLALSIAGAYLRRVSATSCADYLRLYETSWTRLHAGIKSLGSYKDRTLCSTWQVSFEQIEEQNPLAANLLRWWAFFDNDDVWFELLQPTAENLPAWMYELADELNFNNAMGTLQDYGFVEPHVSGENLTESRGYSIHSCIHSWTINVLNGGSDNTLHEAALLCIASRLPSEDEAQSWLLRRRLLSHAIVCSTAIREGNNDLRITFHNLATFFFKQGKFSKAEEMCLHVLRYDEVWGRDPTVTLNTLHGLAILYSNRGQLKEAEEIYFRVLGGKEHAMGPEHSSTLDTVNNLAALYLEQGRLKEAEVISRAAQGAEEMYLRALEGKVEAFGPEHPSTLDTINNLATLYTDQGRLKEAEVMYERALRGREKALGPEHPSTLDTVNNLATLYTDQGRLKEAEEMYLRALEGKVEALGPEHISTFGIVSNLAVMYEKQERLKEAEVMYVRALRGYEKAVGKDATTTYVPFLNVAAGLGGLYDGMGQATRAKELYRVALMGLRAVFGDDNDRVKELEHSLADP